MDLASALAGLQRRRRGSRRSRAALLSAAPPACTAPRRSRRPPPQRVRPPGGRPHASGAQPASRARARAPHLRVPPGGRSGARTARPLGAAAQRHVVCFCQGATPLSATAARSAHAVGRGRANHRGPPAWACEQRRGGQRQGHRGRWRRKRRACAPHSLRSWPRGPARDGEWRWPVASSSAGALRFFLAASWGAGLCRLVGCRYGTPEVYN